MSVTGLVGPAEMGITDAHSHLWIEPVAGALPGAPVLNQRELILAELGLYRRAGGGSVIDCQPGGCGRASRALQSLSVDSGVRIVCCSGYHRQRYYGPDAWLWRAKTDEIQAEFARELSLGTRETRGDPGTVRAGFVKAALEASLAETPLAPLEAAARAAAESGAALLIHTERGLAVEDFLPGLLAWGVRPAQVILCHIDKRPDFGLHRELAKEGYLLEYDTFYRPLYDPETNLWPLIQRMVADGWSANLALATDMADSALWRSFSGASVPGMAGILELILPRLEQVGIQETAIKAILGRNIANRLASFLD